MKNIITDKKKDPLGAMMLDYLEGNKTASAHVESTTLEMWQMTATTMFRTFSSMNRIEKKALSLCKDKILDIGAGSGCHSRYLQKKHPNVQAIDISPGCVEAMKRSNVSQVMHTNLFSLKGQQYDTLLMLMNGIGICGDIDGLHLFFQFIKTILKPGGQVLADSTDLAVLYPANTPPEKMDEYYGQTQFIMTYKDIQSDPFDWLYIDFDTLKYYANFHGFSCEKIITDRTGKFLTRLQYSINS